MLVAPLTERDASVPLSSFPFDSGMDISRSYMPMAERMQLAAQLKKVCSVFNAFPVGDAAFEYGNVAKAFVPLLDPDKRIQVWNNRDMFVKGGEVIYYNLKDVLIYPHEMHFRNVYYSLAINDDKLRLRIKNMMQNYILEAANFEKFRNPENYLDDIAWQKILTVFAEAKQLTGYDLLPRKIDLHIVTPIKGKETAELWLAHEGAFVQQPDNRKIWRAYNRDNVTFPTRFAEAFFDRVPTSERENSFHRANEIVAWVSMSGGFCISHSERFALRLLRAINKNPSVVIDNGLNEHSPNAPENPIGTNEACMRLAHLAI